MDLRTIFRENINLAAIFIANLLLSLHYYLILYVNSSFLGKLVSAQTLGFFYIAGAFLNLMLFLGSARIIRNFSTYTLLLASALVEGVSIVGMAMTENPIYAGTFFILHTAAVACVFLCLDIYLEGATSGESSTGKLRGTYLTLSNITLVISPMIGSFLILGDNYTAVYTLSSLLMIPLLLVIVGVLKTIETTPPDHVSLRGSWRTLSLLTNVKKVAVAQFVLHIFYVWMIIYTPLYLHEYIGFDWSVLGILFMIMLLPFVLLEIPVGKIADERFGEKEFMVLGFLVMAISVFLFPLISTPSFGLWALLLFMSRVGASLVEVTTESYFFKQVSAHEENIISLFRSVRPLAYIITPTLASVLLYTLPLRLMFPVLGFIVLLGILSIRNLKDTR